MSRYERRKFFETLCELRDRYAHADARDRTGVISIEEVVEAVAVLMAEPTPEPQPADQPQG